MGKHRFRNLVFSIFRQIFNIIKLSRRIFFHHGHATLRIFPAMRHGRQSAGSCVIMHIQVSAGISCAYKERESGMHVKYPNQNTKGSRNASRSGQVPVNPRARVYGDKDSSLYSMTVLFIIFPKTANEPPPYT